MEMNKASKKGLLWGLVWSRRKGNRADSSHRQGLVKNKDVMEKKMCLNNGEKISVTKTYVCVKRGREGWAIKLERWV